ncbi:MAG TPA: hypothetical protein VGX68_20110 [Thermoanaerobaculia bacterium]|jgi:tetratricopeptide (TPR) repeat protein|nr:hypothetical protein [Thermoanaerobaculia bacterium]
MARNLRSLIISILAAWHDLSQKEIAAGAGFPPKRVSRLLSGPDIEDGFFEKLLAAVKGRPAKVLAVTGCLEALEAVEQAADLTDEELAEIETAALEAARLIREGLTEALRKPVPQTTPEEAAELRRWLLCDAACEQSVREASRNLDSAAAWVRLAREIAGRARLPEGARLQGYAAAHEANILRVITELTAAESVLQEAKDLWESGHDPYGVLDPGRLLEIEASLRREQRRFHEALDLLERETEVGRAPEQARIQKAFTLEAMGEYEGAIEVLLQAAPKVDQQQELRLKNVLYFNLAVLFCHIGRYDDAAELVPRVRSLASAMGDEIDLVRLAWLEGRVAAGQGWSSEARRLLAKARQKFAARGMTYEVSLTLLEEAVLLLEEGRIAEVKALITELATVFKDKRVHREALAALRLFHEAAEREKATVELARRVLRFLFRARYDESLQFES